jgi:hypothetical protein
MRIKLNTWIMACTLAMALLTPVAVEAGDEPEMDRLTVKMLHKRDALLRPFVAHWLKGAEQSTMNEMLLEMIRLELPLANKQGIPLFTTEITDSRDIGTTCTQVANAILKHHGVDIDSAQLFVGREFEVYTGRSPQASEVAVDLTPVKR